ncbi:MAG: hypothetical protein IKX45_04110 [Bacteroidales bacterium]|nr:hypothetical protein [Bacteroidales bacterium]
MRKYLITCILVAAGMAAAVAAQAQAPDFSRFPNPEFAQMIYEQPWAANLTTCPYEVVARPGKGTRPPRGYKPFYISHYGRHGARSGWSHGRFEHLIEILSNAKDAGILSASGDSLLQETLLVKEATDNMEGRLTLRGQREHRAIAGRMYKNFRRVFRRGSHNVRAYSSTVPRCLVSMAAFTNCLNSLDPKLNIVMDCGEKIQKEITNDSDPDIRPEWHAVSDSLKNAINLNHSWMMAHLFTDTTAAKCIVADPGRLSRAIYSVGRLSCSFDYDFNIFRHIPFETLYAWADYNNVYVYLGQCNSIPFGDSRMERTKPLVRFIIRNADEAIAEGNVAVDLKFGHDYPLLALCSYLGVEGIAERYGAEGAQKHIISTLCSPFAGNLQLVFYKSRKAGKPVLVKVLLNEREVRLLGLEPVQGPYYSWEELRAKISC